MSCLQRPLTTRDGPGIGSDIEPFYTKVATTEKYITTTISSTTIKSTFEDGTAHNSLYYYGYYHQRSMLATGGTSRQSNRLAGIRDRQYLVEGRPKEENERSGDR